MFGVISFILVVAGIASGVFYVFQRTRSVGEPVSKRMLSLAVVLLVVGVLFTSGYTVSAGERGVVIRFGKIRSVSEVGLHFKIPLVDSVEKMSVRTQLYTVETYAVSKDLQDAITTMELNFSLSPGMVQTVYETMGKRYVELVVQPAVPEAVKSVTAKYNAEELITNRSTVKADIISVLSERLQARGVITETVNITNFQFSEVFNAAIEQKVVAQQNALQAENKLKQIEVEARQVEIAAKGQANASIAKAEGDAKSTMINAEAQAKANNLISTSLTPELVQYALVNNIGSDVKVILLPSDQGLLLNSDLLK